MKEEKNLENEVADDVIESDIGEKILDEKLEEAEEASHISQEENEEANENIELKNQLLRLQADFSNYKKRVEKEREGYVELGVKKLAIDLLPVLDNLERALNAIAEHAGDSEIFKGINMIDDQIIEVLSKNHINEIKAEGERFDPSLHHAVAVVETDEMEEDTVVDVLQKGYKINDNVIRPSMVRVSKK